MGDPENQPVSTVANKKAKTREQILQSALTCFGNKGYHQTTMDDIVAASGLSKGALYWHFKGKQELFLALIEWFLTEIGEEAFHSLTDDMSATEKIQTVMRVMLEASEQIIPFFNVFLDFWARTTEDEQLRQIFDNMIASYQAQIVQILEEGVAQGEFRPINTSHLSLAIFGMVDALFLYQALLGDKIKAKDSAETALAVILAGLKV